MSNVIKGHDNLGPAADCLTAGGLALVPTETVYGVGVAVSAFAANLETPGPHTGYGRIFTLKQRELTQTVPWLVDGPAALERYGKDVPHSICALAEKLWPGALTLVVPAADDVPLFLRAADGGYGRIFTLKQRELTQTVPWLVDGPAALERYGKDVPHSICALAEKLWPGALTLVVPAADDVPLFLRAADGTVGEIRAVLE